MANVFLPLCYDATDNNVIIQPSYWLH